MESTAYGTHSLRRTKAAQIYRKTGNLRAVQLLLGHTKIESTVRYLGIEVDDALSCLSKSSSERPRRRANVPARRRSGNAYSDPEPALKGWPGERVMSNPFPPFPLAPVRRAAAPGAPVPHRRR